MSALVYIVDFPFRLKECRMAKEMQLLSPRMFVTDWEEVGY